MNPNELHSTMFFKHTCDPGPKYEERFFKTQCTTITLTALYWSGRGMCGAVCTLQPDMQKLHRGRTVPHISVSKDQTHNWSDVDVFVTACENAHGWREYMPGVQHSFEVHAFRMQLNWVTRGTPRVHLANSTRQEP